MIINDDYPGPRVLMGGVSARNLRKVDFPEMCWPGGQIIPTPRGSILHPTRASQVPYRGFLVFRDFRKFAIYFPIGPGDSPEERETGSFQTHWYREANCFLPKQSISTNSVPSTSGGQAMGPTDTP